MVRVWGLDEYYFLICQLWKTLASDDDDTFVYVRGIQEIIDNVFRDRGKSGQTKRNAEHSTEDNAREVKRSSIILCRGEKDLVTVLAQLKKFVKIPYLLKLLWTIEHVGPVG